MKHIKSSAQIELNEKELKDACLSYIKDHPELIPKAKKKFDEVQKTYTTEVVKVDGGWTVKFTIGVQTFTLGLVQPRAKAEAQWYKKMLHTAFDNLIKQ